MQTQNQVENKAENAKYETLGEPATILVGKQGFIEVAHKRATFKDGSTRDFVLIARGYVDRAGRKRTERLVTIPAEHARVLIGRQTGVSAEITDDHLDRVERSVFDRLHAWIWRV